MSAEAAQPLLVDPKLLAEGKIDIRPDYPVEAQAQGLSGSGVFVLHIHQSDGRVVSVAIQKSTGHKILDEATVSKFSNLRFKTHMVSTITIPVEFALPRQSQRNLAAVTQLRTIDPFPRSVRMNSR